MNSVFSEQILADKLSKLNSTQQCIETLSHWCIFHRQKAEQVVQTWDKQFHSSDKERKIPYLYLANDILQNSKRKGNEFVTEFWKVLPTALKDVVNNGEDHGKNVVARLVGIWEERKVFGSHARSLKELMTGSEPLPVLEFNKKRARSVRIMKRDSRSVKIKLSVGGTAEKIVSAFHNVLSEHRTEDADLKRCKETVHRLGKLEKDVKSACLKAKEPERINLAEKILDEETFLKECVDKLRSVETSRAELVARLREALQEQESELENVRTQLQVAEAQIGEASNMRKKLNNEVAPATNPSTMTPPKTSSSEPPKKTASAIAAEVADRLAASTHSQQIMTSVLSSFAAEEAKNANLRPSQPANPVLETIISEKRSELEKPMVVSSNNYVVTQPLVGTVSRQQYHQTVIMPQPSIQTQPSASQQQYTLVAGPSQHYMQPTGGQFMIGVPYTYNSLTPPPPQIINLTRPTQMAQPIGVIQQHQLQPPMTLQQPMSMNQQPVPINMQQPVPPSYRPLQPPGMAFYHHQAL